MLLPLQKIHSTYVTLLSSQSCLLCHAQGGQVNWGLGSKDEHITRLSKALCSSHKHAHHGWTPVSYEVDIGFTGTRRHNDDSYGSVGLSSVDCVPDTALAQVLPLPNTCKAAAFIVTIFVDKTQ